jgi:hypothetical protein
MIADIAVKKFCVEDGQRATFKPAADGLGAADASADEKVITDRFTLIFWESYWGAVELGLDPIPNLTTLVEINLERANIATEAQPGGTVGLATYVAFSGFEGFFRIFLQALQESRTAKAGNINRNFSIGTGVAGSSDGNATVRDVKRIHGIYITQEEAKAMVIIFNLKYGGMGAWAKVSTCDSEV